MHATGIQEAITTEWEGKEREGEGDGAISPTLLFSTSLPGTNNLRVFRRGKFILFHLSVGDSFHKLLHGHKVRVAGKKKVSVAFSLPIRPIVRFTATAY